MCRAWGYVYGERAEDGDFSVVEAEGWVPIEMLPRKVKRGSRASSSNLCWQFCN